MESNPQTLPIYCYCGSTEFDPHMLICMNCKKRFHLSCLKSDRPSDLAGDIYFKFTCINCSSDGTESFERMKLQWTTVLMLSLYNLQLQGGGKCGYYRWREHVCRFIDKNWGTFFGSYKKKSATWHGTVAGCLSNGANRYFISGVEILGESGWWALKSSKLPTPEEVESSYSNTKTTRKRRTEEFVPLVEGSRKKNSNVMEAALNLKEKKARIVDDTKHRIKKKHSISKMSFFPPNHKLKLIVPKMEPNQDADGNDKPRTIPKIIIKTERSISPKFSDEWTRESEDIDLGISQDIPGMFDLPNPLDSSEPFNSLLEDVFSEMSCDKTSIKSSPRYESDEENSNSGKVTSSARKVQQHITTSRKKKAVTKEENLIKETVVLDPKYTLMSTYDEDQLLVKLESYPNAMKQRPDVRRLYRKLVVRKLKRERNVQLFDIDAEVRSIRGMDPPEYSERENISKQMTANSKISGILDRYQVSYRNLRNKSQQYSSFITRLMGLEDEQHESIISPYTERILKPFIFRDYSTKPLKLKLLEEIVNRTNKSNPDFVPPKQSSIDYCYVRPQHIPAINALCQEFFWPGIDLSESLQYPDFSCVALYRKVIVGFAFMVPDVKYNEAYITFIFCHPEWRRAGIATFLLYHLIQTCMGKDVTLHVSATSSAVFLYQKFGFKVEEFIHDFYDKYLPPQSKECRHALFLRLSR